MRDIWDSLDWSDEERERQKHALLFVGGFLLGATIASVILVLCT